MNQAYLHWLNHPKIDQKTRQELNEITDINEIEDRFYQYLPFGTGGIRGLLGAGTNRLNQYTIRRISDGVARYFLDKKKDHHKDAIVIAYDCRLHSRDFALESAMVFAHYGIPVYLFAELRPTPLLSFTVRYLRALGGIVITASHNAAPYNGYKVYGADGAQLLPEETQQISRKIDEVKDEIDLSVYPLQEVHAQGQLHWLGKEIDEQYLSYLCRENFDLQKNSPIRVVFTPLHGTGTTLIPSSLKRLGFHNLYLVPEQSFPDPNFSTVGTPNPEKVESLNMAKKLAQEVGADVVIGSDPDADRVGVMIRCNQEIHSLTGNQIGVLLLYYRLYLAKIQGTLPDDGIALKTIVTSDMGEKIASHYGVKMMNVLTGFKYIAAKIEEIEQENMGTFMMAYEESCGYLMGNWVRDKDAIQASAWICNMAAHFHSIGLTLKQVLHQLFERFGYYHEAQYVLHYPGKEGKRQMMQFMAYLRNHPPIDLGNKKVIRMEDYQSGFNSLPPSNVLKIHLEDQSWVAIRPSGTEPKLKFYLSVVDDSHELAEKKMIEIKKGIEDIVCITN
ncbi:phospho-sugar mutase [Hazenella sp. IB182353]|uniref:phospho-sugar mutase n=1 Tax=Polycladospora coralii TaxID=2771432 RepID=UPI0017464612|nr:phospho-sugar mutase [Polycladospora coralii]MBS7529015.1 phospho-sugar mutase [Polycladospora coralii]